MSDRNNSTVERIHAANIPDELVATEAYVIYSPRDHSRSHCATKHRIQGGVVQPGTWVDPETFITSFDELNRPEKHKAEAPQWLPYRILVTGSGKLIWHVPSAKRYLHFTEPRMKKLSGLLPVPDLVFKAKRGGLSVYAMQAKHPTPDTRLYECPLPNIYKGGKVCTGSMPTHGTTLEDAAKWTTAFFDSAFSHYTYKKFWEATKAGKKPRLKPANLTIEQL